MTNTTVKRRVIYIPHNSDPTYRRDQLNEALENDPVFTASLRSLSQQVLAKRISKAEFSRLRMTMVNLSLSRFALLQKSMRERRSIMQLASLLA
jgi:hypothetical protein